MADLTAVTQDIRSLLISAPNGLTPSMLEKDYKDAVGCPIPYKKFGYFDCLSFVRSIPETVRISMRGRILLFGIADKTTEHIFKMVKNQKKAKFYSSLSGPASKSTKKSHLPQCNESLPQGTEFTSTASINSLHTANTIATSISDITSESTTCTTALKSSPEMSCHEKLQFTGSSGSLHELPQDYMSNIRTHSTTLGKIQKNSSQCKKTSIQSKSSIGDGSDCGITSSFVPNTSSALALLQKEIMELLKDCTNGICSTEVPGHYKKKFCKELDLHKHGYYSIVEFFVSMTDRVHMCRLSRCGDWLLKLRSNMNTFQDEGGGPSLSPKADIAKIEKDIKELTNKYKGGIVIKSLEDIYEMHFGRGLPIKELGVQSVAELICLITDKIDILNNELCLRSSSVSFVTMPPEHSIESAPIDAVGRGVCYNPPTIPCAEWGFFDCFVSHVSTPEDFMIQVISEQTTVALDALMNEIEKDYNHPNAKEYKMPPHMAKKGQICVALYQGDNNWNRSVINSDPQSGFVDVLYVDYGDVASVAIDSLYLMKSKFLQLPALMIRCRLAHLKPPDLENWTPDAKRVILDLSRNKPMVAEVISSGDSNKLSIVLCDTSQPNVDVYLNDVLLEKNLATLVPDDATPAQLLTIRKNIDMKIAQERQQTAVREIPDEAPPPYQARDTRQNVEASQYQETGSTSLLVTAESTAAVTRKQKRFLKPYLLKDNVVIHVINYEGNAMVASGEISSLFRPDANDLLVPMLLLKDLDFPELALENVDKHTELFHEFKALKVKGAFSLKGLKSIVTLYQLSDVPAIIDGLDHNNKTLLKKQFAEMILSFDPAASHWFRDEDIPPVHLSEVVTLKTPAKSSNEGALALSLPSNCSSSRDNTRCLQFDTENRSEKPSVPLDITERKQQLEQRREQILKDLVEDKPNPHLLEELQDIFQKISFLDNTSNLNDDITNKEDDKEASIRKIWSDAAPTVSPEESCLRLEQMFSSTGLPKPFTPKTASLAIPSRVGQHQKSPTTSLVATITPFIPSTQRGNASSAPVQETRTVTTASLSSGVCSFPPGLPPPPLPQVAVTQVWYCLTTMSFIHQPCNCVTRQACWIASQRMTDQPPPSSWACPPQQPVMRCLPPPPPGLTIPCSQTLPTTQCNYFLL